jgi:formylmethanofuran dehydrogenase subunit E
MHYPTFFNDIPTITLHDPLGEFLGAFEDGVVEISYLDCAKLAGHSCPTVASAYLMATAGLNTLYPDGLPRRSQISIEMQAPKAEGVTGVIGNVIAYIVGAGDEGGFKGIGGTFSRNDLLRFGVSQLAGMVRLTRIDTGDSVTLSSDTSQVPGSPEMMPLMQKAMQGAASDAEKVQFQALWQGRVEAMLLSSDLQDKIITIHK